MVPAPKLRVTFCPTLNHFVWTGRCLSGPICCVKYWVSNITRDSCIMDHTGILTGDQRNTTKTNMLCIFPSLGRKLIIDWVKLRGSCATVTMVCLAPCVPVLFPYSGDW